MAAYQPIKPSAQSQQRYKSVIASMGPSGKSMPRMASASNGLASKLPATVKLQSQASEQPFYKAKSSAFATVMKPNSAALIVDHNDVFPAFGRSIDKGLDTRLGSQIGYDLKV